MAFPKAKRFVKSLVDGSPGPSSYSPKSTKDISNPAKNVSSLYKTERFKDYNGYYVSTSNLCDTSDSSNCLTSSYSGGDSSSASRRRGRAKARLGGSGNRSKSTSNLQTATRSPPPDKYLNRSFLEIKLEDTRKELSDLKIDFHNLQFENEDLRTELNEKMAYIEHLHQHIQEDEEYFLRIKEMSKELFSKDLEEKERQLRRAKMIIENFEDELDRTQLNPHFVPTQNSKGNNDTP